MNIPAIKAIDHIDIVTTHDCNMSCPNCIDKFLRKPGEAISVLTVHDFLYPLARHAKPNTEILLLGGEPTTLPIERLIDISLMIRSFGFKAAISTNGKERNKILQILPYYDWVQITVRNDAEIEFYNGYTNVNAKLNGDKHLTIKKLEDFIEKTAGYQRRSLTMYFTPDHQELCQDPEIWALLNSLEWERKGSYDYGFYKGMRIKKCIPGATNMVDEPTIPKLYPNGNYNKTWGNEDMDDYLKLYMRKED